MDTKGHPPSYSQSVEYGGQQGYPPQQQGYPAPQSGYPAAPQGYPPAQPMYPPATQSNTSMSQTTVVVQQPGVGANVVYQASPPDYFVSSILACFFCFWPTGLAAIYFANRSRTMLAMGNIGEAHRMANNARNLIITSVILGICWIVLVIVLRVVVYTSTYDDYYK